MTEHSGLARNEIQLGLVEVPSPYMQTKSIADMYLLLTRRDADKELLRVSLSCFQVLICLALTIVLLDHWSRVWVCEKKISYLKSRMRAAKCRRVYRKVSCLKSYQKAKEFSLLLQGRSCFAQIAEHDISQSLKWNEVCEGSRNLHVIYSSHTCRDYHIKAYVVNHTIVKVAEMALW